MQRNLKPPGGEQILGKISSRGDAMKDESSKLSLAKNPERGKSMYTIEAVNCDKLKVTFVKLNWR